MAKAKKGDNRAADIIIKNWLRTSIEFLGTWKKLYNPNFKVVEFYHFKSEAGFPLTGARLYRVSKAYTTAKFATLSPVVCLSLLTFGVIN